MSMRIITGTARGKRIVTPAGLETRPTSEMVKEAVFSMIQFEIEGARMLDLFAGSGQMGLEALSRGARACVFVDNGKAAQRVLAENLENTGFLTVGRIVRSDAMTYLRNAGGGPFDIAFLDPPYQAGLLEKVLPLTAEAMTETGVIICETTMDEVLPEAVGDFTLYRRYRYGKTQVVQYRIPEADEEAEGTEE